MNRTLSTVAGVGVIAIAAIGAKVVAQPEGDGDRSANPLMMNLPAAVAATEGCLGVELAQTQSGKNVIFAWFENKQAAMRWYWSEAHTEAMKFIGAEPGEHEPMVGVPDEGPILVIASITRGQGGDDAVRGDLGVTQIAIELYQPLPGGAELGGRFAPEGVRVPMLVDYSRERLED